MVATAPRRRQSGPYRPLRGSVVLTDVDRAVLNLIEALPLREWPRSVLLEAIRSTGLNISDRAMRKSIERLRHAGRPVVSNSASGGGYSIARTASEIEEFRERELHSRMRVIADASRVLGVVAKQMRDREARGGLQQALL